MARVFNNPRQSRVLGTLGVLLLASGCNLFEATEMPPREAVDFGSDVEGGDGTADGGNLDMGVALDANTSVPDTGPDLGADLGSDAGQEVGPLRILFVGDSFTSTGPIPDLVSELAEAAGCPLPKFAWRRPTG